jgi:hypothetical protein
LTTCDINLNDAKILRPQSQVDDCVTLGGRVSEASSGIITSR